MTLDELVKHCDGRVRVKLTTYRKRRQGFHKGGRVYLKARDARSPKGTVVECEVAPAGGTRIVAWYDARAVKQWAEREAECQIYLE